MKYLTTIGTAIIESRLALAPMAGVTDLAFRAVCREHGAGLTYTEMVSAKALCFEDKKTKQLLLLGEREHPAAAQIFGSDRSVWKKGRGLRLRVPAQISLTSTWAAPCRKSSAAGRRGADAGSG